jgi:hypothetical protein
MMRRRVWSLYVFRGFTLLAFISFMSGCALSPDDKVTREQLLKQQAQNFVSLAVQGDWDNLFKLTDGSFEGVDRFKVHLTQPWDASSTLTGGSIASMSWVSDSATKVKINWVFQEGSVMSYSSETFAWVWKDDTWKYKGRVLR